MSRSMPRQPVLWRRPWWARAGVAAGLWALLVAYGSLIPFEFDFSHAGWSMLWLSAERSPVADLALNLVLYVPLGVLLRLAWGRWWLAAMGVVGLSYALECVQGLSPTRVGAWQDVIANALPGVIAAVMTPRLAAGFQRTAFTCYTHSSQLGRVLRGVRARRGLMWFIVGPMLLLVVLGWVAYASPAQPSDSPAVNWLPFGEHFARSYDTAAWLLGRSLLVYCVLGMLLSMVLVRRSQRRPMLWVALGAAVIVGGLEWAHRMLGRSHADVTEPIVAVLAVAFTFTTAWMFVHAVRCTCRRRRAEPVARDRRRRPHDYRFALRP